MNLLCHCVSCKAKIQVKLKVKTKIDIFNLKGDTFSVICPSCKRNQAKTPDEFLAVLQYKTILIGFGFAIFLCFISWTTLRAYALLFMIIPIALWLSELNKTKVFNETAIPAFD